ncbi:MAG: site-2 protease family protein [Sphaerobacter sp.]|nr:site-2 protease family protein [Sphaerobacter sp.]
MEASFKLGRIRGIQIGIHFSWLIVFGLLAYSLAAGFLPSLYRGWSAAQYWTVGALAALLLFASVLAHELGHSFVAQSKGIPVRAITLFIFGGVAQISRESQTARDEFQIAIAGPAVSLVIGATSLALWWLTRGTTDFLAAMLLYLGLANLILVGFNLIPGFPLDGGRVFRATVWAITGNLERATRIAAAVGVGIGYLFILGGIFYVFVVPITGIWLIAIGWFLQNAAEQSYRQMRIERAFAHVKVGSIMDPHPVVVRPDITLAELVERYILARNVRGVPVVEDGRLVGIITLTDLRDVRREDWDRATVRAYMTPMDKLVTLAPDSPLDQALQALAEHDIHQIPVVEGTILVGLLTRSAVIRYLQLREELPEVVRELQEPVPERERGKERGPAT